MEASEPTPTRTPRIEPNARPQQYPSTFRWINNGIGRQQTGMFAAVIGAWTGLPFALWLAAVGLVGGMFAGIIGASHIGIAQTLHVDEGVGVLAAIVGGFLGTVAGFLLIPLGYIHNPPLFAGAFISGFVVGFITLAVLVSAEPHIMRLRGYRELSRREKERLHPLLLDAGRRMGLPVVPELWMSDSVKPAAWTHMRAIVVTRGLLDYDDRERPPQSQLGDAALGAILAHELHHWNEGDAVGLCMVWSCFWPIAAIYNAGAWLRPRARGLGTFAWVLFWPAWVTTKLIVVPLMMKQSRLLEYEADARAASLGDAYRLGLRRALDELSVWEQPRTGWEDALMATHPPIELRLERLEARRQPAPADDPVPVIADEPHPLVGLSPRSVSEQADQPAEAPPRRNRVARVSPRRVKAKGGTPGKAKPSPRRPTRTKTGGNTTTSAAPGPKKPVKSDADDAAQRWLDHRPPESN